MGQRSWVRAMKCQLLAASLFIMLLGLSVSILSIVTYCGKHFTVIKDASLEKSSYYRSFHSVVFYTGICVSIILMVASLLSIVATVRELESGMAACGPPDVFGLQLLGILIIGYVGQVQWELKCNNMWKDLYHGIESSP